MKIVKYATDITEQIRFASQLRAAVEETRAAVSATTRGHLTRTRP
jgi:hypothetical protein